MHRFALALLAIFGSSLFQAHISLGGEIPSGMLPGHQQAVVAVTAQGGVYLDVDPTLNLDPKPSHLNLKKYTGDYSLISSIYGLEVLTLPAIDGATLRMIDLPNLKIVRMDGGTFLDDDFINFIGKCPNLESLTLVGSENLTDKAMTCLESLRHLQQLQLLNVSITDEGLKKLPTSLTMINIVYGNITPQCLESLGLMTNLVALYLGTLKGITDKDVEKLKPLEKLKILEIRSSELTNTGLEHLSNIASLESLSIRGEKISDGGIHHLSKLKLLKSLHVYDSRCSKRGLARLQRDLLGPEDKVNRFSLLQSSIRRTPTTGRRRR